MDNWHLDNVVKKEFYKIVKDAQNGITLNITQDYFSYVRFNYIEEGNLYGECTIEEYLGSDEGVDEIYEAEYSNGSANYLPTLKVDNKKEFFGALNNITQKYLGTYNFTKAINALGENNVIKSIILTIFSNARYADYENPVLYMNRYIDFLDDTIKLDNDIENISMLSKCKMITSTKRDIFGYETPYCFETVLTNGEDKYYLPTINYGISDNKCYVYSIQNKHSNDDTSFNKTIKRKLNKVNANVEIDVDYENKDTILGVPPSFVIALSVFLKTLKNKGINDVEVITFLPDRYFEKKASEEYDADLIQSHLTERLVLLFYRMKYHINDIEIYFPIYDGIIESKEVGENLIVKLGDKMKCDNNPLLEEILSKISSYKNINKR